jgi:hypothetical protein
MKNKIAGMLDAIANTLEEKGLIKEATSLDMVSNTLEALSFDTASDPLIVKVAPGKAIKADSMVLVNQLKRDLGLAIKNLKDGSGSTYADTYNKGTDKTKSFGEKLENELKKAGVHPNYEVKNWKAGNTYDLSALYTLGKEMAANTRGYAKTNNGVKAVELLDTIADTYEES